jgi:hypothetical protein
MRTYCDWGVEELDIGLFDQDLLGFVAEIPNF